jgi:hypothetical protein
LFSPNLDGFGICLLIQRGSTIFNYEVRYSYLVIDVGF